MSGSLIKTMSTGLVKRITLGEDMVDSLLQSDSIGYQQPQLQPEILSEEKQIVEFDPVTGKQIAKKVKQPTPVEISYADFECNVSKHIHNAYSCCLHSENGEKQWAFWGKDSANQMLDMLPKESITYFPNLHYDRNFFALFGGIVQWIEKSGRIMIVQIIDKGKRLSFKYTLSMFNCPLKTLPDMFKILGTKKELFPYRYYTLDNINNPGVISKIGRQEVPAWSKAKYETIISNIDAIEGCRIDADTFDRRKYAEFY
jgi:hypothetical protein